MGCNPFLEKIWELEEEIKKEEGYKKAPSCGGCKFIGKLDYQYNADCSVLTALLRSKLKDNNIRINFNFRVNTKYICKFYKERLK